MLIPILATVIRILWAVAELAHTIRSRSKSAGDWDKHSAKLWDVANAIEPIGMLLGFAGIGRIQTNNQFIATFGLVLLITGLAVRASAVYTLGKNFSRTVVIKDNQRLVKNGLYKYLRHPSYTGTLIAHLGLGLSFANWFSLGLSSVPYFIAAAYRIRVEERALEQAFGSEYEDYARTTKRLIPRVY